MRHQLTAASLALVVIGSAAARAEKTYTIDKVTISGSKSVPSSQLYGVLKEHAGMQATREDIVGDQTAISNELTKANVVGGIKTQLLGPKPNGHYEVTFIVQDNGVQAPTVAHVAPKLDQQTVDGNVSIPSDKLLQATGLQPGEEMTNEKDSGGRDGDPECLQGGEAACCHDDQWRHEGAAWRQGRHHVAHRRDEGEEEAAEYGRRGRPEARPVI